MNRDHWIHRLKKVGLAGYEAQVYLALLGETRAPVSRIVRKSGVPQSKVYGALTTLVERGFAEQVLGEVKLFRCVPPDQAFENYRREIEGDLADAQTIMSSLAQIAPDVPSEEPGSLGVRLVRPAQMVAALRESIDHAQRELLVAVRAPFIMPPDRRSDRMLMTRGVDVRYLVESALLNDPEHGEDLRHAAQSHDIYRFTPRLPMRLLVRDRTIAMLELNERDGTSMGLIVPNDGLAENLRELFNQYWGQAQSIQNVLQSAPEVALSR